MNTHRTTLISLLSLSLAIPLLAADAPEHAARSSPKKTDTKASHAAGAVKMDCTHAPEGSKGDALAALAKVSREDAERAAKASLHAASVTTEEAELEVERTCLVWSFDLQVAGKKGLEEVQVDAGTGKVIRKAHESARHETKEKVTEAAEKR